MDDQTTPHAGGRIPAADHYLPVRKAEIIRALAADPRMGGQEDAFARLAGRLGRLVHVSYFGRRERIKDLYVGLNPDQPGEGALTPSETDLAELMTILEGALIDANFRELPRTEIERAENELGRVRARVKVPWEAYQDVRFFVRGRGRTRIDWKSFFGLLPQSAEVPCYDQVVMIARVHADPPKEALRHGALRPGALYLKLFRDIPAADLNTLFPNGRVIIARLDQAMIAVPAVVGGVPILLNIIPALSVLFLVIGAYLGTEGVIEGDRMKQALAAISGVGALGGFLMRQWVKWERQALKYQKIVSDNAHFKNVNNNATFFDFLFGASEESEVKEMILAYFFLLVAEGPLAPEELDRRVEEWLRDRLEMNADFDVQDAVGELTALGLATREGDGLRAVGLDAAIRRTDEIWASLADPAEA